MPYGDRTGSFSGFPYPGYLNPSGRGYFCRGGRGRGCRNRYYKTGLSGWMRAQRKHPVYGMLDYPLPFEMTEDEELEFLKRQAEILQRQLKEVKEQIDVLEKSIEKEK